MPADRVIELGQPFVDPESEAPASLVELLDRISRLQVADDPIRAANDVFFGHVHEFDEGIAQSHELLQESPCSPGIFGPRIMHGVPERDIIRYLRWGCRGTDKALFERPKIDIASETIGIHHDYWVFLLLNEVADP